MTAFQSHPRSPVTPASRSTPAVLLGAAILLAACYAGGVLASSPGALRDKLGIPSTSRTPLSAIAAVWE